MEFKGKENHESEIIHHGKKAIQLFESKRVRIVRLKIDMDFKVVTKNS